MKKQKNLTNQLTLISTLFLLTFSIQSYAQKENKTDAETEKPEYFLLRPEVEKAYGYS